MRGLSDTRLAGVYTGGFQTVHRYSAAHSARRWRLEHAAFTPKADSVFMPGLNSTAAVFQPTVT